MLSRVTSAMALGLDFNPLLSSILPSIVVMFIAIILLLNNLLDSQMTQANLKTVKQKLKIPNRFDVILLNDDYTSMEFVVDVLRRFFNKEFQAAEAIMLKIHIDGEAVCGSYSYDVAQTKVKQVIGYSRDNDQPLMAVLRELGI